MSKKDKLINRLLKRPKDFTFLKKITACLEKSSE